jgi:hypothetical protein
VKDLNKIIIVSGKVRLIHFLEVVLLLKSAVVLSIVKYIASVLKTDRLAAVSASLFLEATAPKNCG